VSLSASEYSFVIIYSTDLSQEELGKKGFPDRVWGGVSRKKEDREWDDEVSGLRV
jgi:hypothetical protein